LIELFVLKDKFKDKNETIFFDKYAIYN